MKMSGLLDIINSISVFQLVFFTIYLIIKGNKIPSTFFLKIHLFFQLIGYINYVFWTRELYFIKPLLIISIPVIFTWAPTFYFYIRSRLYKNFVPHRKLLIHAVPSVVMMAYVFILMLQRDNLHDRITNLERVICSLFKIQIICYNLYTLYLIYRYQQNIKLLTSAKEKQKLNWLFFITYGFTICSIAGLVLNLFPDSAGGRFDYVCFWIFINLFFFKAIVNPDQYLGIDEKKLMPVKLSLDNCISNFRKIEEIINSKQLFLDPDLSLHNLAQTVDMPDRIVSQSIKQNRGLNFTEYINKKRIGYAMEVLQSTTKSEKNVLEILYEAGFNSKSVFNTQFKKHTGLSPSEYREIARDQNNMMQTELFEQTDDRRCSA